MKFEKFKEELLWELHERFPDAEIITKDVIKNNDTTLTGLIIKMPGKNVSANFYLEYAYMMYGKGCSIKKIADMIEDANKDDTNMDYICNMVEQMRSFNNIKDKIVYRLVSKKRNNELLKDIPHRDYLDMAINYAIILKNGVISVNNQYMDLWGVTESDLYEVAKENTSKLLPVDMEALKSLLERGDNSQFTEDEIDEMLSEVKGMSVITNSDRTFGATTCLYDGLLDELAAKCKKDPFVVLCCVHEFLVMDSEYAEYEQVKNMIDSMIEETIDNEDVLSDTVYYYDRAEKRLKIYENS
jgi:hypothetical protein